MPSLVRALLFAAAFALLPMQVSAQSDKAQAETLFQQGRALMKEAKYESACAKFADSMRLDASSGTEINLGQCYEALGRTASAWAEYRAAATLARNLKRADHEQKALALASAIEPKLSKLRIVVSADVPGLVVQRDGTEIAKSSLGTPVATDPGEHTISASAPGYETWSGKVTLAKEGDSQSITVPALSKAAGAASATPSGDAPPPPPAKTVPSDQAPPTGGGPPLRTVGFVVGGVGVAGIAVGAIFGALAASDKSQAESDESLCGQQKLCTSAGRDVIDGAKTKALVSTLGIGIGAAALAAGVVLVLVAKPSRSAAPSVGLTADASTNQARALVTGSF